MHAGKMLTFPILHFRELSLYSSHAVCGHQCYEDRICEIVSGFYQISVIEANVDYLDL